MKLERYLQTCDIRFPCAVTASAFDRYTDKMEFECIEYAFLEAKHAGKHSLGYVRAVLDRLLKEGIISKDALPKCRNGTCEGDANEADFAPRFAFEKDEFLERMEEL